MSAINLTTKPIICVDATTGATPGVSTLDSYDAQKLVTGCQAFVLGTRQLYQLDKSSTLTPRADLVIAAKGGGRWLYFANALAQSYQDLNIFLASAGAATLTGVNNWVNVTSSPGQFSLAAGSTSWTVDLATGFATLAGITGTYMFNVVASVAHSVASSQTSLGITVNNVGSPDPKAISRITSPSNTAWLYQLATTTTITLSQGDTLQVKFAGVAGTLSLSALQITAGRLP